MNRTQLINKLVEYNGFKTYLELGVENPSLNFNNIHVEKKDSVDINPNAKAVYTMSTDDFFEQLSPIKKYDLVFIDAMHVEEYVDRDLTNALKHLNPGGMICLHDVIPISKNTAQKKDKYDGTVWNGDVYRSVVKLFSTPLNYVTVFNYDHGLTILYDNDNKLVDTTKYTCDYAYEEIFNDSCGGINKITELGREKMHLITESDFTQKFSKVN